MSPFDVGGKTFLHEKNKEEMIVTIRSEFPRFQACSRYPLVTSDSDSVSAEQEGNSKMVGLENNSKFLDGLGGPKEGRRMTGGVFGQTDPASDLSGLKAPDGNALKRKVPKSNVPDSAAHIGKLSSGENNLVQDSTTGSATRKEGRRMTGGVFGKTDPAGDLSGLKAPNGNAPKSIVPKSNVPDSTAPSGKLPSGENNLVQDSITGSATRAGGAQGGYPEIVGDAQFVEQTRAAIDLLRTKAPSDYDYVMRFIPRIQQGDDRTVQPATGVYTTQSAEKSVWWYAACIVHEAKHVEDYKTNGFGNWSQVEIESSALHPMVGALRNIGAPQYLVDGAEKYIGVHGSESDYTGL